MLQLRGRQLPVAGRRGRVCLSAAYFLFAALQMVSRCRTSRRQAPVCRADEHRGQKTLYRVRRVLCVQLKQRQILPGLPEAYHEPAGSGAHEETPRPCYAVRAKTALIYAVLRAGKQRSRYRLPFPSK